MSWFLLSVPLHCSPLQQLCYILTLASHLQFIIYLSIYPCNSTSTGLSAKAQLSSILSYLYHFLFLVLQLMFSQSSFALILTTPLFFSSLSSLPPPLSSSQLPASTAKCVCIIHCQTEASHHMAGWPCPTLPGIHDAAKLIHLSWLATQHLLF